MSKDSYGVSPTIIGCPGLMTPDEFPLSQMGTLIVYRSLGEDSSAGSLCNSEYLSFIFKDDYVRNLIYNIG